jgi:hypothetical protein
MGLGSVRGRGSPYSLRVLLAYYYYRISPFSALAGKYSPTLRFSNQQDYYYYYYYYCYYYYISVLLSTDFKIQFYSIQVVFANELYVFLIIFVSQLLTEMFTRNIS